MQNEKWLQWIIELQGLAQAGLFYSNNKFDLERFQRIREISAEMLQAQSDLPLARITQLFCNETGYQTPKIDTRAAIFQDDQILLVQEENGLWALPGGWCDVIATVKENVVKEVKEEAGLDAVAEFVIALQDHAKNNPPALAHNVCKVFIYCRATGGEFMPNSETLASGYFSLHDLPPLATGKTTEAQIKMCFQAHQAEHWQTIFD
ncbi:NUDIX hydrolase N-terminal domain-containing protein [Avibacterium avium]|uniref:NUDIX hydrolase N-terminal domain-containing protein n=1 Tax=Avibacterium avium TaxID=751 RepID=UPI003BF840A4